MARDGTIVPLFGVADKGISPVISAQKRVNMYVSVQREADKSRFSLCPRPGLDFIGRSLAPFNDSFDGEPFVRGIMDGELLSSTLSGAFFGYCVVGNRLCIIRTATNDFNAGSPFSFNGTAVLSSGRGPVRFTRNNTHIFMADGRTGYAYNYTTGSLATMETEPTATGFPAGATTCCFLAGRIIVNKPNSGRFYWSDASDALTWNSLSFANAEASPDNLLAVATDHGELLLFGQYTTEFWVPSTGTQPFERIGGAAIEYGVRAVGSIKRVADGTIFLGQNYAGDTRVLLLRGTTATPISTPEIETQIQDDIADASAAEAMTFTANGHTFYVLSFNEKSLVYDVTTGLWSEFTTGTEGGRWIGQYGALVNGTYVVTDRAENRFYALNTETYDDGGETIVREIITKHTFADYDRASVFKLGLDVETGVGLTSGQGVDPQIMLQVSRDNGRTWGNEVWRSLGALGDYLHRVWFTRLGRARDWLFRIRMSDPVKLVITGGSLKVGP